MVRLSNIYYNYFKTRTWAIFPPIDIDLKNPYDERNIYQEQILPPNVINLDKYTKYEPDIRDVSGLKPYLKEKFLSNKDIPQPRYEWQLRRNYARYLYAVYGKKSNIDPSLCWPTKQEIVQMTNDEKEYEKPMSEHFIDIQKEKDVKNKEYEEKLLQIRKNMANMGKMIKEFTNKVEEKEETEAETMRVKRYEESEEAREYFGYRVSAHDPRYKKLMEEREMTRKKEQRLVKQKEKAAKKIATIQQ